MALATFFSLLLTLLTLGDVLADDQSPIVTLPQGTLRGQKVTPENLAPYYSFQGIPYAKPPVGELRFKAPVPAGPWNGTLEALQDRNICVQQQSGDEDCLYLNVYTPELPNSGSLKPVMVWIHGGGFSSGSGNKARQDPRFLLNSGIVYVSLNYRLGILGFLSTEDEVVPGNMAMKDQVLALRWVQQNIAAFGGDPTKVTIFGESAGASSVHFHMLSPMSKGLFRGAIADSGCATSPLHFSYKPKENAFLVGKALGFSGESTKELVDFLRNISARDLISTSSVTLNPEDQYRIQKSIHETPCVEPVIEGEEAYLTEHPITILDEGRFHKLPYMTGVNLAEGLLSLGMMSAEGRTYQEIDENFMKVFKPELLYCSDEQCGDEMVTKMRSFYFGDQPLSKDLEQEFVDMCTDVFYAEGSMDAVKKMSKLGTEPVYFYHFIYNGTSSKSGPHISSLDISGPGHGEELTYIFYTGMQIADGSLAAKVRSRMVAMWTNFVKTGNPTPEVTEELPTWLPYNIDTKNYLEIGVELEAKTDYNKKRMDFWEELYNSRK